MRIFLIDYENVHCDGLTGVDALKDNDEVVIFYSNNADSISFEMMHKLMFCKAKLSYYKIRRGGRNALDFQMSSYLGYLINACGCASASAGAEVEYFLISKDNGFDFVIDFWESGNINVKPKVKRFHSIKAVLTHAKLAKMKTASREPAIAAAPVQPAIAQSPETPLTEVAEVADVADIADVADVVVTVVTPDVVETVAVMEPPKAVEPPKPPKPPKSREPAKPAKPEASEPVVTVVTVVEPPKEVEPAVTVGDAAFEPEIDAAVEELIASAKSSHDLYISTVKRFGQKKGVELYRNIKSRFSQSKSK